MPVALSTTKRKFHKILDSITNTSDPSLPLTPRQKNASTNTLPTTLEPPAKKPRIARPKSAYTSSSMSSLGNHASTVQTRVKQAQPMKTQEETKAPNFTPWDRGQFLDRLKTFRHVDKWMSKPEPINEVQWAKRGWRCVGKERVGCVGGCGKEVVIKLEEDPEDTGNEPADSGQESDEWRKDAQEQLVERYSETIVSGHEEGCLWRSRGCDGTIYRLSLTHPQTALNALRQRYESLAKMSSDLPSALSVPKGMNITAISRQITPFLLPDSSKPSVDRVEAEIPPNSINEQALALSLFGWQAEGGHITGLATCEACFRRLGLWLFKTKPTEDAAADEEASMSRLDVVSEHRDHCPWINAASQSGGSTPRKGAIAIPDLAGWESLLRVVRNTQHIRAETMPPPATASGHGDEDDDVASEVVSIATTAAGPEDRAARDAKDKERWAKLKKLKQAFHVKRSSKIGKGKDNNTSASRPDTAG
ncbi:MAG: hypothetical protein FRX48_03324 [Lasallia pustulata]|uniref:Zinc finger, C3HC-like n=1 Tax=Lasallia pustulata TaxID=136370 RepID=A0A5M8PV97_9LECA|nr:MAG: hypothetical protein FRX48_03324 [Lasallia pustulata]